MLLLYKRIFECPHVCRTWQTPIDVTCSPFFFLLPLSVFFFFHQSNKDPALGHIIWGNSKCRYGTDINNHLRRPFRKALELKQTAGGPGPADFNTSVSGGFVFTVAVPPCLLRPPRRPALCSVQLFWELQIQTDINMSRPHGLDLLQPPAKTRAHPHTPA